MEWVIAVVVLICLYHVFIFIQNSKNKKEVEEKIFSFKSENLTITKASKQNKYDYLITIGENKYYLKMSYIPSNSCVTINYKDTLVLRYGAKKGNFGRSYPKERYMNELVGFLNSKYNGKKIIVFYKSTEKILKYLNESDIGIVTYKDNPYDMKVMVYDDFINHFGEIIQ